MTDEPSVAIVGMSGRFPGAPDLTAYWDNLRDGRCSIVDFTERELADAGVPESDLRDVHYVRAKGFLADADRFEAELFGVNGTDASTMDPQHRLLLEAVWGALEDAGHDPTRPPRRTGVYVGGGMSEHMIAAAADPALAAKLGGLQLRILTDREFLASWLSYLFGFDGPSVTVQTACSTSLTAVHLACQALLLGECDTALAGGVSLDTVRPRGYLFHTGGVYAPDGRCRPFDEHAAGTVPGNGVGVVVLRRLEDALADGDPVWAVVRGSAVTNDGSAKVGFTAPGVDRQTAAIVEAWIAAGLTPSDAQYVEMHGTGTALGDRVELAAVTAALGDGVACRIGSVKANLGHLDAAAGIAGLIKVVLMLANRTLVPTVNVGEPNADLAAGALDLVTATAPWPDGDGPRLAGVTSVGIGGTNAHVVLAEAPAVPRIGPSHGPHPLVLSARTPDQLRTAAARLADALSRPDAPDLADVAHTLRVGRAALAARTVVVADSPADAVTRLRAIAAGTVTESDVDISDPAGRGARRVHLPTYPFAGEHRGAFRLGATIEERAPKPATEEAVTEVFRAALGLSTTDELDQSFFGAGGDSLTAVHLVERLREEFEIEVPIELFLDEAMVRDLVTKVITLSSGAAGEDALLVSLLDEIEAGT